MCSLRLSRLHDLSVDLWFQALVDLKRIAAMCSCEKIAVLVSFIFSLAINGLFSSGEVTGKSIGDISNEYPTYAWAPEILGCNGSEVTPDGVTFSIWAVIYTLELILAAWSSLSLQKSCVAP